MCNDTVMASTNKKTTEKKLNSLLEYYRNKKMLKHSTRVQIPRDIYVCFTRYLLSCIVPTPSVQNWTRVTLKVLHCGYSVFPLQLYFYRHVFQFSIFLFQWKTLWATFCCRGLMVTEDSLLGECDAMNKHIWFSLI